MVSTEDDDPLFKCQINELMEWLPRLNDIEKNKEVENDDSINANHEKTGQTNKNVLLQRIRHYYYCQLCNSIDLGNTLTLTLT